ncbi:hypothetical protein BOX15_Mlig003078g1 [Macrostomum lignano]|uniref:Uncharacterized protein n=1 Tax=Macrostomum lignano TaxID=282301 RepID=A0A267DHJ2_9PLAT|nr:hypothetical protein BOX15_Mlig003078g1 [Macrostomum lignano]
MSAQRTQNCLPSSERLLTMQPTLSYGQQRKVTRHSSSSATVRMNSRDILLPILSTSLPIPPKRQRVDKLPDVAQPPPTPPPQPHQSQQPPPPPTPPPPPALQQTLSVRDWVRLDADSSMEVRMELSRRVEPPASMPVEPASNCASSTATDTSENRRLEQRLRLTVRQLTLRSTCD